ncbi:EamA family transporter [Nocardioides flavescens]|uniref:EamA family transporter n=1 Tax=Nocardioides flavescens TaxID=2691959 RepID=UPI001928320E
MGSEETDDGGRAGLALVCGAGVVWGTIGPVVDVVVRRSELTVWTAGAYRAVWALLALAAVVAVLRRGAACARVLRRSASRTAAVGVLTGAFQVLFFVSVGAGGVTIATVVALGVAPLAPMVLRSALRRRPPGRGEVVAVVCAVSGLLLVSLGGAGATDPAHPGLAVAAAVGSGVAFGLSAEVAGPLTQVHDSLAVAALSTGVAALVVLVAGLAVAVPGGLPLGPGDPGTVLLVAYLGVGTMALAYVLFFAGLRTTASGTAVLAALLEPVTAVVIAVLLLGERLTVVSAVGAVLIVATIASLGRRPVVVPR